MPTSGREVRYHLDEAPQAFEENQRVHPELMARDKETRGQTEQIGNQDHHRHDEEEGIEFRYNQIAHGIHCHDLQGIELVLLSHGSKS